MRFCHSPWFASANTASFLLLLNLMCTGNITTQKFPLTPILSNDGNSKQLSTATSATSRASPRSENSAPSIFVSLPKLGANAGTLIKMNNHGIRSSVGLGGSMGSGNSGLGIVGSLPSIGNNAGSLEIKDQGLSASVGMDISSGSGIQAPKISGSLPVIGPNGAGLGVNAQGMGTSAGIGASLDSGSTGSGIMGSIPSIGSNGNADISEELKSGGLGLSVGLGGSMGSGNSGLGIVGSLPSIGNNAGSLEIKDQGLSASVGMDISSGSGIQAPKMSGSLPVIGPNGAGLGVNAQGLGTSAGIEASLDSSSTGSGIMGSIPSIGSNGNADISEELKSGGLGLSVGLEGSPASGKSGPGITGSLPSIGNNAGSLEIKDQGLSASVGMDISSGSGIQAPKISGSLPVIGPNGAGLGVNAQGMGTSAGIGASLDSGSTGSGIMGSIPSIGSNGNADISEELKSGGLGLSVGLGGSMGSGKSRPGIAGSLPSIGNNAGSLEIKDQGLSASVGMDISSGSGIQAPKISGSLPVIGPNGAGLGVNAQGMGTSAGIEASLDSSSTGSGIMGSIPSIGSNGNADISEELKSGGLGLSVGLEGSLASDKSGPGIAGSLPSIGNNAGSLEIKDQGLSASVGMDISSGSGIQAPKISGSLPVIGPNGAGLGVNAQGMGTSAGIGASLDSGSTGSGIMGSIPSIGSNGNADISEELKSGGLGLSVGLGGSMGSGKSRPGIAGSLPSIGNNAGSLEIKDQGLSASVGMDISSGSGIQAPKISGSLPVIGPNGAGLGVNAQGMGTSAGIGASLDSGSTGSGIMGSIPSIGSNGNADISEELKSGGLGLSVGLGGSMGSGNSGLGIVGSLPSIGNNAGSLEIKDQGLSASVGMDISSGSGIQAPKISGSLPVIGPNGAGLGVNAQGMGTSAGIEASLDSSSTGSGIMGSIPSIGSNGNADISEELKSGGLGLSVGLEGSLASDKSGPGIAGSLPSIGNNAGSLEIKDQGLSSSVGMDISSGSGIQAPKISGSLPVIGPNAAGLGVNAQGMGTSAGIEASLDPGNTGSGIMGSIPSIGSNGNADISKVKNEGFGASVGLKASLNSSTSGSASIRSQPKIGGNGTADLLEVKKQVLGVSVGINVPLTKHELETSVDLESSTSTSQFETTTINKFTQTEADTEILMSDDNRGFRKQLDLTTLETFQPTEVYEETTNIKNYQTIGMYDEDVSTSSSKNVIIMDEQPTNYEYSEPMGTPSVSTEESSKTWVQKISTTEKSRFRMLKAPPQASAEQLIYSGKPVWFGQIITNVLYGAPWSAYQTNSKCVNDMRTYNLHVRNYTLWATKMLDATSKGPEGLLDGNTFSFGNFDQCMSTKSKTQGISGGYSLVDIDFRPVMDVYPGFYDGDHSKDYDPPDEDKSMWEAIKHNVQEDFVQRHMYQWAVCLPDTCQSEDVQKIVSNALVPELKRFGFEANVTINPLLHTSIKNTFEYTAGFYIVCAIYASVAVFVFVATLYDLIYLQYRPKSKHGPMKQIMKPFSLISNLERLLKPSETEEFSIINGLKVCAILQVIIGHRWFMEFGNPQSNPIFVHWVIHNVWFGYFKCTIFLETFFVISGFLTFHIITKQLSEKKRLNFIPIMIYRWLRIFPVYGTLIATYIFILPYLNDGPYWREIIYRESERCQNNWWTNVLFINNYIHTDELCIIPSWYLACDMHFFVIGTLLTYAVWKRTRPGLLMLGACLIASTITPAYVILNDQHWGTAPVTPDALHDLSKDRFYTNVYIKSHMRAMTYLIGVLAGYVYMKLKEADYKLSLNSRIFWAPVVLMIGNCIYLSSGMFFALGHKYVAYEHAIYFTLGRLVWSLLICYGIIGHGLSGFGVCISDFLGHRIFHVTGKLVFCIYMFQEIIQLQTIASMRTPTYQNLTLMTWRFGGDTLMAMMYAFAINVMIESPFDRLQKNIMKLFMGDMFSKPKPLEHSIRETIDTTITTSTTTLYVVNYSGDEQFSAP